MSRYWILCPVDSLAQGQAELDTIRHQYWAELVMPEPDTGIPTHYGCGAQDTDAKLAPLVALCKASSVLRIVKGAAYGQDDLPGSGVVISGDPTKGDDSTVYTKAAALTKAKGSK